MIAAVLVFYMPEEEAFFCFNAVMRRREFVYRDRLQGAQRENKVLECLLRKLFPQIEDHFRRHGVPISYAAIQYSICLMLKDLPLSVGLRVLEQYICEGDKALYRA